MKLLRLIVAALTLSLATAACSSDVTSEITGPSTRPSLGQGTFGSGG